MKSKKCILLLLLSFPLFTFAKGLINVKDFGAKGDGNTNDFAALSKAVNAVNLQKGGTLYFPPGVYYINAYHNGKSKIQDLEFKNCNELKIYGDQATISVKGDFYRPITRNRGGHAYSDVTAIIPLKINNCRNVIIMNLELDGNVDQMTRGKGVVESGGHLLYLVNVSNVTLENLKIHHAQTDGIYITGKSGNVIAQNITSSNNARQGMSIIQLVDGKFYDCKFIHTGYTGGTYGSHAPGAGVDIEPHHADAVSNILFENCLFENNKGSQLTISHPTSSKDITIKGSRFVANNNNSRYAVIVNAKNVTFETCTFDLNNNDIYPIWQKGGVSSTFRNCIIKSNNRGIVAVDNNPENHVVVDHCTLEYTGKTRIKSYFPYINMRNMEFTNNTIKVPKELCKEKGPSGLLQNVQKVAGLKYISNGKVVKPQISFQGAQVQQ